MPIQVAYSIILTIDKPYPNWTGRVGFPNQIIKEVAENTSESFAIRCGPPIMIKLITSVLLNLGFCCDCTVVDCDPCGGVNPYTHVLH